MKVENKLLLINKTESPSKTRHICYYVKEDGNNLILCEIVENWYKHPDAPEDAYVQLLEDIRVKTYKKWDEKAGELMLLLAAQNNCKTINKE